MIEQENKVKTKVSGVVEMGWMEEVRLEQRLKGEEGGNQEDIRSERGHS